MSTALACVALAAPAVGVAQDVTSASAADEPVRSGPAYVHIEEGSGVTLRRRGGRFGTAVCGAPCDRVLQVSSDQLFHLEGSSLASESFALVPHARNDVAVEGDAVAHGFGFAFTTVGGATLGVGGLVFGLHTFLNALYGEDVPEGNVIAYGSMMGGGALLLAIGIPLLVAFEPELVVMESELGLSVSSQGVAVQF